MASGITLKVEPTVLKSKANEITTEINTVEKQWNNLKNTVKRSKSYWEGDAGTLHQQYITDVNSDVEQVLKRLKEHPKELLQMAKLYDEADDKARALSNKLPTDVIK